MNGIDKPRLIVRLHGEFLASGVEPTAVLEQSDPQRWRELVERHGEIALIPVFDADDAATLRELQGRAIRLDPTYRPEPLDLFFEVAAPGSDDLTAVADLLRRWGAVRSAEIEVVGPDPRLGGGIVRATPISHLSAAPDGIDAQYARTVTGGAGHGVRVADVERGWTVNHIDLQAHHIAANPLNGTINNATRGHGTSVLGIIAAVPAGAAPTGIASEVDAILPSSHYQSTIRAAILAVIRSPKMRFGDVLLVEAQVDAYPSAKQYGPVELIEVNYEILRLATALGIIVVETGGNGTNNGSPPAVDLDHWSNPAGDRVLWRNPANGVFRDSGAIIVAAASSTAPHTRLDYSTFGARIDCFAWGENVSTLDSNSAGDDLYTSHFGATSAAGAIIAGAALSTQGAYEAAQAARLSPRQMRTILGRRILNTEPAVSETTAIGVMPDLRTIIQTQLGLTPDVYIRDNTADSGDPHTSPVSTSPDVVLRPAPVPDPQVAYGQGSGTEQSDTLGFQVASGQDNVVYVRVRNRGGSVAHDVTATVYWSPAATLLTPDLWTLVGSVTIPTVPTGDVLTVSGPLLWPAARVPAPGAYSLVVILDSAEDPGPQPAEFLNFDDYQDFIRRNNNVTTRSINVVGVDPDPDLEPEGFVALPFLIRGALDMPRSFTVELVVRLPSGGEALVEFPSTFTRDFDTQLQVEPIGEVGTGGRARLPVNGRLRFGPARLAAGASYPMRLLVRTSVAAVPATLLARQFLDDGPDEVGRVTWILAPDVDERLKAAMAGDPVGALD